MFAQRASGHLEQMDFLRNDECPVVEIEDKGGQCHIARCLERGGIHPDQLVAEETRRAGKRGERGASREEWDINVPARPARFLERNGSEALAGNVDSMLISRSPVARG